MKACVFECSTNTYLECVERGLFGANHPWVLQVYRGDLCWIYHRGVEKLFGIWQAETDGARDLEPEAWAGRFPYQVRIRQSSPEIIEIPKPKIAPVFWNEETGRLETLLDRERTGLLIELTRNQVLPEAPDGAAGGR